MEKFYCFKKIINFCYCINISNIIVIGNKINFLQKFYKTYNLR